MSKWVPVFLLIAFSHLFQVPSFLEAKTNNMPAVTGGVNISKEISYMGIIKNIEGKSMHVVVFDTNNNFVTQTYSDHNNIFRLTLTEGKYNLLLIRNDKIVLSPAIIVSLNENKGEFYIPENILETIKKSLSMNTFIGLFFGFLISMTTWLIQKNHEANELSKNIPLIFAPSRLIIEELIDLILKSDEKKLIEQKLAILDNFFEAQKKEASWLWSKVKHDKIRAGFYVKLYIEKLKIFLQEDTAMMRILELRNHLPIPDVKTLLTVKFTDEKLLELKQIILGFDDYVEWLKGKYVL